MIELKSEVEIGKMRAAGAVVAEILRELAAMVEPGGTTAELDSKAERMISLAGCRSAFKNYQVG
ncbi:MAG: type I methionyl aminopeptidase, partial [Deltaproteobacteria bacterium]|nr:type I methionyl aminopeptidase [Deltaproteobacteria bacterium]